MIGRPISEAPHDGTAIIAEIMNYSGVPETGGYGFKRLKWAQRGFGSAGWVEADHDNFHYGVSSVLRWFPDGTDTSQIPLTTRTNWKFVPSNGTHGEIIYDSWCAKCIRERPIRDDYEHAIANGLGCDIYSRTLAFRIDDPQYPEEWTYQPDGEPKCTAFEKDIGQANQEPRCPHTTDLFKQAEPQKPPCPAWPKCGCGTQSGPHSCEHR